MVLLLQGAYGPAELLFDRGFALAYRRGGLRERQSGREVQRQHLARVRITGAKNDLQTRDGLALQDLRFHIVPSNWLEGFRYKVPGDGVAVAFVIGGRRVA